MEDMKEIKIIETRCKELYDTLKFNHNQNFKYWKKFVGTLVAFLLVFFIGIPVIMTILSNYLKISFFILLFILLILILYLRRFHKKTIEFKLTDKEFIIIRLCSVANYLANFVKSDIHSKDIIMAKKINELLIWNLNPLMTPFTNLFVDRGFTFETKLKELFGLIRKLASSKIKPLLEGKREDDQLKDVIDSYRHIAYQLDNEDFTKGSVFIENHFKIETMNSKISDKILAKVATKQLFRWLCATLILIILCVITYYISKKLEIINDVNVSIWIILGVLFASIPAIVVIKNKIVDLVLSKIPSLKKK